jgi:hypothetical protein
MSLLWTVKETIGPDNHMAGSCQEETGGDPGKTKTPRVLKPGALTAMTILSGMISSPQELFPGY